MSDDPTIHAGRCKRCSRGAPVNAINKGKGAERVRRAEMYATESTGEIRTGGRYRTIVADPPWCYRNAKARKSGAVLQYPVMAVEDIAAIDMVRHAFFDAHLWLWATNQFMEQAHWVMRSWGFEPLTILTWCKSQPGVGNYLRNNTEHCLLGSRGFPQMPDHKPLSTWFVWPRTAHSRKPDAFYDIVEQVSPGPYLELFARRQRLGWDSWGDEVDSHVEMPA